MHVNQVVWIGENEVTSTTNSQPTTTTTSTRHDNMTVSLNSLFEARQSIQKSGADIQQWSLDETADEYSVALICNICNDSKNTLIGSWEENGGNFDVISGGNSRARGKPEDRSKMYETYVELRLS